MPDVVLAHASPVDDLMISNQGPNTKRSAISVASAFNNSTASQAQETCQPEGPSSNAVRPSTNFLGPQRLDDAHSQIVPAGHSPVAAEPVAELIPGDTLVNHMPAAKGLLNTDVLASSLRTDVGIEGKTTNGDTGAQSTHSLLNDAKSSSTGPQASTTVNGSDQQTPSGTTNFAHGTSTSTTFLGMDSRPGLLSGKQIIPATSDSQDELFPTQILPLVSGPALGSDTSTSAQALLTSITQVLHDSDSTASLLFRPSATPSISKQPSPLTISGQTVTANSLGQYAIDDQTLTPGGVITVSGSKISLAPHASGLVIGKSTETLGPSITANLSSGPEGTDVQKFTANALGAKDGLWSSSTMLLVSFLLLLWL